MIAISSGPGGIAGVNQYSLDPTDRIPKGFRLDDGSRVSGSRHEWKRLRKTVGGFGGRRTGTRCDASTLIFRLVFHLIAFFRLIAHGTLTPYEIERHGAPHQDEG